METAPTTEELPFWLAFHRIPGVGRQRFAQLQRRFGSMADAWRASREELLSAGLDTRTVSSILGRRSTIEPEREIERLHRLGVSALTWLDPAYPSRLREIHDAPVILYIRGELRPADEWCVAVVGTRKVTAYGRAVTEELAGDLARNRVTVVSGLAIGADGIAHTAALASGGRTVAVLGCGVDIVYPAQHRALAERIVEHGAVMSDYPPGTEPRAEHFPRRNRVISGLSLGTLITEGDRTSGSMITARLAMEQNREVFAVPGSILSPQSEGPNLLIQQGAKLVSCVADILEELNLSMAAQQLDFAEEIPLDDSEAELLRRLSTEPTHIDDVRRESGLPIQTVSSALAMLELKGMVRQVGNMNFVRIRETAARYQG